LIRYDLVCAKGHEFDGWFANSAAYDVQEKRGLISCTECGVNTVQKQIMAPGIPTKSNRKQAVTTGPQEPKAAAMLQMMREYRKQVESTSENVGDKFAEEARKIHYKEKAERPIYGEATRDEVGGLIEEGIAVQPIPRLPEDGN
jgi:hypothetical protein